MPPYTSQRLTGMAHFAMLDAFNPIERLYRPYLVEFKVGPASKEAAAIAAAAKVLP
jgi:hypothetical protein